MKSLSLFSGIGGLDDIVEIGEDKLSALTNAKEYGISDATARNWEKLVKLDPKAKKDCPLCRGRGVYTALHVGEYDELPMSMKCACTNGEKNGN